MLVGVPINPHHSITQIEETYEQKIVGHAVELESSTLELQCIIFGYQRCWWSSLKFSAPITCFKIGGNILSKIHAALLPKIRVMMTIPVAMRYSPVELGGLVLHSLEVESMAQAINNIVPLHAACNPKRL